ncbi:hypothetical protein AB0M29_39695 [Streptomyces sp. NPDC051976]|uniref:hypothetical protein n=1 Tax=Streptomyces sp. NPDC051976 TaxID=3154947 RepID=UPI0034348A4C
MEVTALLADNPAPEAELQSGAASTPGLILHISGGAFGDPSFLNLRIRTHQRTDLRIVGLRPPLDRLFELAGADAVLRFFPMLADPGPSAPPVRLSHLHAVKNLCWQK